MSLRREKSETEIGWMGWLVRLSNKLASIGVRVIAERRRNGEVLADVNTT